MNRREFAVNISHLLLDMAESGDMPIGDNWNRSAIEQFAFYQVGRKLVCSKWVVADPSRIITNCDGYIIKGDHQLGRALDIYLVTDDKDGVIIHWEWNKEKALFWHYVWEKRYKGKPMIKWDPPHFAG